MKRRFSLILWIGILLSACAQEQPGISSDGYKALFEDPFYRRGFELGSVVEGDGSAYGCLDYNQTIPQPPYWRLGQWNCFGNDLKEAVYHQTPTDHQYKSAGGNLVQIGKSNGWLTLVLNTESEYGHTPGMSQPRAYNEPWPALLIERNLTPEEILPLSTQSSVQMRLSFTLNQVVDRIPQGTFNSELHAAQLLWYITVQNRNAASPDYGRYIWFGLALYDSRYDYVPHYAAQDGGKEQNTGAFIYIPEMEPLFPAGEKVREGKRITLEVEILPLVKEAFALAQERNYLTHTSWEELWIGATNIGFEAPGTYNISATLHSFNIWYR